MEDYANRRCKELDDRRRAIDVDRADDFDTRLDAVRELEDIDGGQRELYNLLQHFREQVGETR